MQQVIQNVRNGRTLVREIPSPACRPGHLVIAEAASLISVGTERYVVELARKNLIGKMLDRPDQVRRLLQKVRQEGLRSTLSQAQGKLDEPMTLGCLRDGYRPQPVGAGSPFGRRPGRPWFAHRGRQSILRFSRSGFGDHHRRYRE